MNSINSQNRNSFDEGELPAGEELTTEEVEELEQLAAENGRLGKIARAWLKIQEDRN